MKILFDAFWWESGPTANRNVMKQFVESWSKEFPRDELVLAVRKSVASEAISDMPEQATVVHTRLPIHGLVNAIELPRLKRKTKSDWVVTHNFAPLFGKSLVFIHDLLFEDHPEWFTTKELAYFSFMSKLAYRATVVATSTQSERMRIERLHPKLAPVKVTGLGVADTLAASIPRRPDILPHRIGEFFLSVGRLNRRKNLGVAIQAASQASNVTSDCPLVIVGSAEYSGATAELPSNIRALVDDGRILFLGRVDDSELHWLYKNANALLFLTRDEGFGLPPAEAHHFGAPAIVSDIPVMHEVSGHDAIFVSPDQTDEVAEAIESVGQRVSSPRTSDPDHQVPWKSAVHTMREAMSR